MKGSVSFLLDGPCRYPSCCVWDFIDGKWRCSVSTESRACSLIPQHHHSGRGFHQAITCRDEQNVWSWGACTPGIVKTAGDHSCPDGNTRTPHCKLHHATGGPAEHDAQHDFCPVAGCQKDLAWGLEPGCMRAVSGGHLDADLQWVVQFDRSPQGLLHEPTYGGVGSENEATQSGQWVRRPAVPATTLYVHSPKFFFRHAYSP